MLCVPETCVGGTVPSTLLRSSQVPLTTVESVGKASADCCWLAAHGSSLSCSWNNIIVTIMPGVKARHLAKERKIKS